MFGVEKQQLGKTVQGRILWRFQALQRANLTRHSCLWSNFVRELWFGRPIFPIHCTQILASILP